MSAKNAWLAVWLGLLTLFGVLWWPLLVIYIVMSASAGFTLAVHYLFRLTVWRD